MILSKKWIHDFQSIDLSVVLQIFRENDAAAALCGHAEYEGVPQREAVKTMQIDCRENVVDGGFGDLKLREYLYSSLG